MVHDYLLKDDVIVSAFTETALARGQDLRMELVKERECLMANDRLGNMYCYPLGVARRDRINSILDAARAKQGQSLTFILKDSAKAGRFQWKNPAFERLTEVCMEMTLTIARPKPGGIHSAI